MSMLAKSFRSIYTAALSRRSRSSITRSITSMGHAKKEGDISSVFVSLSGGVAEPLPARFADIKRQLVRGSEGLLTESWKKLLERLASENEIVKQRGPDVIPQLEFKDLKSAPEEFIKETKKRGVAVIKSVVPEGEARAYKTEVEEYVKKNPTTKAFPADNPQIFELYWSAPQVKARSHPNLLAAQAFLMSLWHSNQKDALISTSIPLTYADRIRIRQPGDNQFALGPHVDGGSVERWEPEGYGLGGVYDKIWQGRWEEYDPWESSSRLPAITDMYEGPGGSSIFRMFQGWLGLSHTAPGEGTLLVNPILQLATSYFLLRPFFDPQQPQDAFSSREKYLSADNWKLKSASEMDTPLHGANAGSSQEFNDALHPHLDLANSMVHVPKIKPGDFVVWHCDTIHAVDQVHAGKTDSSVLYIPVCPTTELNAKYTAVQRDSFLAGIPPPDFPGGKGESEHLGRATAESITGEQGRGAMGLAKLVKADWEESPGAKEMVERANKAMGFA